MKKLLKTVIAAVLCICAALSCVTYSVAVTGKNIKNTKRIISVVYDDSASMLGTDEHDDMWSYANYAMQSLTALLDENDELYITYMSKCNASTKMDLSDIDSAVKKVRMWENSGNTPFTAIETAAQTLDGISESDPSTQFWLMIFTDGQISGVDLESELNQLKGKKMSNKSPLNVAFLSLGPAASTVTGDESGGLYVDNASDAASISDVINKMAARISGRINPDTQSKKDDKTISFSTKLPLYSVSVLSQKSSSEVVKLKGGEADANSIRNIHIDTSKNKNSKVALIGNAASIKKTDSSDKAEIIPAGSYEIEFSEAVSESDVLIQLQPAIDMKLKIEKDGNKLSGTSKLKVGDKVNIELVPVIAGTNKEIAMGDLPSGTKFSIVYQNNNNNESTAQGTKLENAVLKLGKNKIIGKMRIPGCAAIIYNIGFDLDKVIYNLGIKVSQPSKLSYDRGTLGDLEGKKAVVFTITNDGVPMSKSQLEKAGISLEVKDVVCDDSKVNDASAFGAFMTASCSLEQNDDGTYTLVPKPPLALSNFVTKAGDYTVKVKTVIDDADNKSKMVSEKGEFTVIPGWAEWIQLLIVLLIILFIVYLFYILFIKYKFSGQLIHYDLYKLNFDGTGTHMRGSSTTHTLGKFSGHLLLPVRACYIRYNGLKLIAGPYGTVYVSGKSIAKSVYSYKQMRANPKENLNGIINRMRKTERRDGTREGADLALSRTPIYFRSGANDRTVWSIKMDD